MTCFDSLYGDGIEGDNKIICRMSVMFSLQHVRLFQGIDVKICSGRDALNSRPGPLDFG